MTHHPFALLALGDLADPGSLTRVLLDKMTEGVSLSREDGTIVYTNPAEDRLFGYGPGELTGQHVSVQNAYPPEENRRVVAEVIGELRRSGSWAGEWRNRRKDGSEFVTGSRISAVVIAGERHWLCVQEDVTKELAAARALEAESARLRIATEAAEIGIWDWDLGTGRMTYSDLARSISGLPPEGEITVEDVRRTVHPEDLPRTWAQAQRAIDPVVRDRRPYEYRLVRPDGSIRWVLAHGEAIFEEGPEGTRAVRYLGTIQDITDRLELEESERSSVQQLRLAIGASRMGVWDLDVATNTVTGSPELYRLLGFPEGEPFSAEAANARYCPGEHERVSAEGQAAFARGETSNEVEFRYRHPEHGVRWLRLRYEVLFDTEGTPNRVVGVLLDETERMQAHLALQETEERFRLIADSAPVMLWMGDPQGKCLYLNRLQREFWGVAEEDIPKFDWTPTIHPGDVAPLAEPFGRGMRTHTPFTVEARYLRADGEYRILRTNAHPRFDAAGAFLGMTGVNVDVTEQRRAEADLQALNASLEARVAQALAERAEAEGALRQSQKMEAVGQLTGGIAHDFNNLLAGIVGSLDLMQARIAQGRTADLDRYVGAAMTSAQRAAALTHRLLAFSRRQPLDPRPVDANKLVAGMEDLLRRTLGPAVALEMVLAGGLWRTLCDPVQLESSLLNLCINARDAMPEGGRLTIETANAHFDDAYAAAQRDVTPGQYVAVCVTDSGVGMSPELASRAFEPFFTTKPIGQGTGLGLSMVYGFARQSEGHVRIYSEEGKGTTVKLYLPRYRGGEGMTDTEVQTLEPHRAEAGETVLVVEDEPVVRGLVVEVLGELGYRAIEASDGPTGLRLLQSRRRIDLLVTDVGLPGLNGRQLADQAREQRPDLKVLFITGYAQNAAQANGFLEPGMAMLTKPFAVDALIRKIRQLVEERDGA